MMMFRPKNNGTPAQTGSTQKLNLVIMAAVSFIALVISIAWVALGMVQEKIQQDTGNALQTVLKTNQESLTLWAENKKFHLGKLAADPRVVSLVEQVLQTPRDKEALLKSRGLMELRKFFQSNKDRFGKYGKLLSEGRFDDDLRKIGLIRAGRKTILSITIRDPGGNMVAGFRPPVPRYQQPLTLMAEQATKGKPGINVVGYRDYRGVPVYGAWLWDRNLGLGLTTEIDVADALSPYYPSRNVTITVLGITVLLAIGSLMFAVLVDERANRALRKSHDELEHRVQTRTAELAESEERFALAVRGVGAGIWGLDPVTGQGWSSERFKELLGYGDVDVAESYSDWVNIVHPDDRYAVTAALQNHLQNRVPFNVVCRLQCKSGEFRWFRVTGQAIWDDNGQAHRMAGSIIDITDGKIAQSELRKLSHGKNSGLKSAIRNPQSAIKSIPIIAMTAHAMAGDEEKSRKAGMNGHVAKPIEPEHLFATLQKWITPMERRDATPPLDITSETSVPDQPQAVVEELPQSLPGFDIAAGLERLMGNKRLYRKLLLDFGSKYTGVAGDIRQAIDKRDFQQAHSLVHNLKGLAGNLAAVDLQAAAVEIEKLVQGNQAASSTDEQLNQKFTDLENAINQALEAVQVLGRVAEEKSPAPSADSLTAVSAELIKNMVDRVKQAVEMGDVTRVSTLAEELKSESEDLSPIGDKLMLLADDFDLEGILEFLDELKI